VAYIGQYAERRHGLASGARVLWVTVDVLEAVGRAVAGRHQLNNPIDAVRGNAGRFVEHAPASEVILNEAGEFRKEWLDPDR